MLRKIVLLTALLALALAYTPAGAEEFYKDKTLRMLVGFSPGGGYDTYTRYIARYIGMYIPGNPTPVGSEHARSREPDHRQLHLQAGQAGREDLGRVESRTDLCPRHGRQEGADRAH